MPASVTDPLSNTTNFEYDQYGNVETVTDPLTHTTDYTYDLGGRMLTQTDALNNITTYTYDDQNNVLTVEDDLGHTTTNTYDAKGQRTSVEDAETNVTEFEYDEAGRLVTVRDALDQEVTYDYDLVGNRTSMTNTRGKTTTYEYDAANRLVLVTDPLSRETAYDYDDAGRRTSRLDANAVTTTYTYDVVDRLTGINYGDTTPDVTFTYDELGNRLTMVDGTGTTEYNYDELYRRTSIEDGQNNVVGYDYDDAGRLVELTYPGGTDSVTYDYDDAGRLTDVTDWLSNVTTYTYDDADRLTSTTLGNGLISDRTYDGADRLTNLTNRDGGTPISSYAYTLDDVGNRTQMVDTSGTTTYTYDALYRLTDATYPNSDAQTYDYDPMGNRTEKTHNSVPTSYSYDDADQMTLAGGVSYDYDDNGNQVAAGSDTFDWDAENRLVETDIASTTGTYAYNGDGLRITRTIGGSGASYVWDLNASLPVVLQDTDGNRYVYGLDLLTRIDGSDEEWYLYDGLGSTTGLADDTGAVTGSYEYDVFGAERAYTGDATEWSFTGEQHDATGLEYLRARYYDENTGRFLARDPVPGGNRYNYVGNNPVSFIDPKGECRVDVRLSRYEKFKIPELTTRTIRNPLRFMWPRSITVITGVRWHYFYHAYIVTADPITGEKTGYRGDRGGLGGSRLTAETMPYGEGFADYPSGNDPSITVRDDGLSCDATNARLNDAVRLIQRAGALYIPLAAGQNSNSAAREMLEHAGLPQAHPAGYDVPLWESDFLP